jgi:hypothetical protein
MMGVSMIRKAVQWPQLFELQCLPRFDSSELTDR